MAAKTKHKAAFEERLKEEEPEEDGGISTKQALIYLAIVVACFGILYPKIIHPMVMVGLGMNEKKPEPVNDVPPQMRMPGAPVPGRPVPSGRPPPAAAARDRLAGEAAEKGGKSGSGGIMMSVILPVYAFGIMGYLLYTASKVYGGGKDKKKKKRNKNDDIYELITSRLSTINLEGVLAGTDQKGAEEINKLAEYLRKKHSGEEADIDDQPITPQKKTTSDDPPVAQEDQITTGQTSESEVQRLQEKLANMENEMAKLMSTLKQNQISSNTQQADQQSTGNKSVTEQSTENKSNSQSTSVESRPQNVKVDLSAVEDGPDTGEVDDEAGEAESEANSEDTEELLQGLDGNKILYEHIPGSSEEESVASDDEQMISDEDNVELIGQFDPEAGSAIRRRNIPLDCSDDPDEY